MVYKMTSATSHYCDLHGHVLSEAGMAGLTVDSVAQVFHLFDKYGEGDYIGERVSQLQHAVQCAMLAEKDGYPAEVTSLL